MRPSANAAACRTCASIVGHEQSRAAARPRAVHAQLAASCAAARRTCASSSRERADHRVGVVEEVDLQHLVERRVAHARVVVPEAAAMRGVTRVTFSRPSARTAATRTLGVAVLRRGLLERRHAVRVQELAERCARARAARDRRRSVGDVAASSP